MDREHTREALKVALDIGAYMLSSGAEMERVEDSIERMCSSFGIKQVEVFAITYMIAATVSEEKREGVTEIRRIRKFNRNMNRLDALNALSREICDTKMEPKKAKEKAEAIAAEKTYGMGERMVIYAIISAAFSLFFGGNAYDCILGGVIGAAVAPVDICLGKSGLNQYVQLFLCSVFCGVLANLGGYLWTEITPELVSIGNIMIFIPGVIFTCALQELFAGNMLSGGTRLADAIMISLVIATGFAAVNIIM